MIKVKISAKPVSHDELTMMFECITGKRDKKECLFKPQLIVEEQPSKGMFLKPRFNIMQGVYNECL